MIKFIDLLILAAVLLQPSCADIVKPIDSFTNIEQEIVTKKEDGHPYVYGKNDQRFVRSGLIDIFGTNPKPHIVISEGGHWGTTLARSYKGSNVVDKTLQIEYESTEEQNVTICLSKSKSPHAVPTRRISFDNGYHTIQVPFTDLANENNLVDICCIDIFGSMKIFKISLIQPRLYDCWILWIQGQLSKFM